MYKRQVVNCIILGRAEMFACKNSIVDSALDGVGMGVGYTRTATLMASIREILGSGTWLGFQVIPERVAKVSIMTQAPGAFFCFGLLMAGCEMCIRDRHADYCFNCGSCSFVCPATRPVTHMMSLAKAFYLGEIKKGGNK